MPETFIHLDDLDTFLEEAIRKIKKGAMVCGAKPRSVNIVATVIGGSKTLNFETGADAVENITTDVAVTPDTRTSTSTRGEQRTNSGGQEQRSESTQEDSGG